ncbi:hypothetical protein BDW62DRAFT_212317 [Aspergillus aurantiobrunneus]
MVFSKQSQLLAALVALAPVVSAAECSLNLHYLRTQNPVVGGENTLTCSAEITYGDGQKETLEDQCNNVSSDRCYSSQLPHQICVTTNSDLSDGCMDYADQHRDFNEDGCTKGSDAGIAGDSADTSCTVTC